jgi:hypothetical protein
MVFGTCRLVGIVHSFNDPGWQRNNPCCSYDSDGEDCFLRCAHNTRHLGA